jgi:HAD superfamily hydrolase (TIGR01549 family)
VALQHVLPEVRVIFFDLDDTLCGYWNAARKGLRAAVAECLQSEFQQEQFLRQWAESFRSFVETLPQTHWYADYLRNGDITRTELMRRVLEQMEIYDEVLARRLSTTYHVERQAALELFPEVPEMLASLRALYPLALITNGPADIQREEITKLELQAMFEAFFIEGEMGYGKPDPRVLPRALEAFGAQPHEALFIGNSYRHDIAPAIEHGMKTVWVRRDSDVSPTSRTGLPESLPEGGLLPSAIVPDLAITTLVSQLTPLLQT